MAVTLIKGLTFAQYKELQELKKTIFKGSVFVEFTNGMLESKDCKRYCELLEIKLKYFEKQFAYIKN